MKRDELIRALAAYLTTNIGRKAFETHEGKADGLAWAKVFGGLHLKFDSTNRDAELALSAVLNAEATYPVHYETPDIEGAELSAKAAGGTL